MYIEEPIRLSPSAQRDLGPSIDEVVNGHATWIEVNLDDDYRGVTISDVTWNSGNNEEI